MAEHNQAARAALLEVVDNQLRDGEPPETRATLDRLMREGIPRDEARRMIAYALVIEMNEMLRDNTPFDEARYVAELRALPDSIARRLAEEEGDAE